MNINESQAEILYFDGYIDGFKKVDESGLEADHKCDTGTYIFEDIKTHTFYQGYVTRIGSEWTDFEWQFDTEFDEVEQVEVTVKQWKIVQ